MTTVMNLSSVKGRNLLAICSRKTNSKLNLFLHPSFMYDVQSQVKWSLNQLSISVE